jgi:hypothetical protein
MALPPLRSSVQLCVCLCVQLITFQATDAAHRPIYHTNVMMAIGTTMAVVCLESIEVSDRRLAHLQVTDIF